MGGVGVRRISRVEYERLGEQGFFAPGERVQLVHGALVVAEPQGSRHALAIRMVEETLREAFGPGWDVRAQLPLALGAWSEPEPDVSVVPGSYADYRDAHPGSAALVVEVAETSLPFDRTEKTAVYAGAGIPECWIVNLLDGRLEVYREPAPSGDEPGRGHYRRVDSLRPGAAVTPLARPGVSVPVARLLP